MARLPRIGDRVATEDGLHGRIVVDIDMAQSAEGFDAAAWAYLGTGLMIETDEIGLLHVTDRESVIALDES